MTVKKNLVFAFKSICAYQVEYGTRPLVRVRTKKLIFLLLNQNICCGYSKEPSQ